MYIHLVLMASVSTYTTRAGTTTYKVRWLEPDGRETSATSSDPERVELLKGLIEANPRRAWRHKVLAWASGEDPDLDLEAPPTLNEWAERYIESLTGITPGTREEYTRLYNRTWKPLLGNHLVPQITRTDVARAVNRLAERLSPKSLKNAHHALLSPMLTQAVEDGILTRHPSRGIRLPEVDKGRREQRALHRDEFAAVLEHIPDHYKPLTVFLVGTGCRWGEAAALTVGDIRPTLDPTDPDRRRILYAVTINKAVKWVARGKPVIGPPKTAASNRTLFLPPLVVAHVLPSMEGRPKGARLFTTKRGADVRLQNFYTRAWLPACELAGISPRPNVHALRHTHACWLIDEGANLEDIQERLGHESYSTTRDLYGHLTPDRRLRAARAATLVFPAPPLELPGG